MTDRFHIIITGENGRSSTFQFSRRNIFIATAACFFLIVVAAAVSLTAGGAFFRDRLVREVDRIESDLTRIEQATALYLDQIGELEKAKQAQLEALKEQYEYLLSDQRVKFDLEYTSVHLENAQLMQEAISELNARSQAIEAVMGDIGIEIIQATPDTPENSGGPFIPTSEASYETLVRKVDSYLRTIKHVPLGRPVDGPITSKFGKRVDPLNHKTSIHEGVDIRGGRGAKIQATAAGVVIRAYKNGSYGNYLEINHGNGYRTAYAHLQKFMVKKGQPVTRGQVIGLVGSTGRTTGPHLHYEVLLNKKPVNPEKFMKVADLSHTLAAGGGSDVQK